MQEVYDLLDLRKIPFESESAVAEWLTYIAQLNPVGFRRARTQDNRPVEGAHSYAHCLQSSAPSNAARA